MVHATVEIEATFLTTTTHTCVLGGSASPASSATMKVRMDWKKRAMKVLNPKTKP